MDIAQAISKFSDTNWERCTEIFKCGDKTNLYWATALSEEVGEVAGAIKKWDRGFNARELKKMKEKFLKAGGTVEDMPTDEDFKFSWSAEKIKAIADEGADVFIYLMLLFRANGIDFLRSVDTKFNRVSVEMGCPQYESELSKSQII